MTTTNLTPFPADPDQFVRARECAQFLGIGVSSFWKLVADGRIERPLKLGPKTSCWKAGAIRRFQQELTENAEQ